MKKSVQKKTQRIREALQQFLRKLKKQNQPQLVLQPVRNRKNIF